MSEVPLYRGASLIRKRPPLWDPIRTLLKRTERT